MINIQKNLTKVVIFNRIFSFAIFLCLLIYLVQVNHNTEMVTLGLLLFLFVALFFHVLLVEVIGKIILKKSILTSEICTWLAKVVTVSITVIVTAACIATGNMFFACFYAVPIILCIFFEDLPIKRIGIFAVSFLLVFQHLGYFIQDIFITNNVVYEPSSIILALSIGCMSILGVNIINMTKSTHYKNNILQSMATTDMLTGLLNRRYFDRRLIEELARSKRHNTSLSLALFDIDHFKNVNDTYGHTAGDKILAELGSIISKNVRESDISARYGGEEFALILPETTQIEASDLLERIRQLIEDHTFMEDTFPLMITISIGLAQYDEISSSKEFIEQADACLYQAKNTGRNKVVYGTFTKPKLKIFSRSNYSETYKEGE